MYGYKYIYERSDVATANIAGSFVIPNIDSFIVIKLDGNVVDIMCEANNKYINYVKYENDKKVLCMRLLNHFI